MRLRLGFLVIAMVVSVFGARLVQLQALDPHAYAAAAAQEGLVDVVLPADRGEILDRNGVPLASSVEGRMVVADPSLTSEKAPALAAFLAKRLDVDYFTTKERLSAPDRKFEYIARRVPATVATDVVDEAESLGYEGLDTRSDPVRDYPAHDVASNVVGFLGSTDDPDNTYGAGLELTFNDLLAGVDGNERYEVGGGNRIPLGENVTVEPKDGHDLVTTLDRDVQFYVQRVLAQTVESARADSGMAVVLDTQTGDILSLADYPTYDAASPSADDESLFKSDAVVSPYEPGSVEKALTAAALIDAGKVDPGTKIEVPSELPVQDAVIHDYFDHGKIRLTMAGVLAKSSNIGTVKASQQMPSRQLDGYLRQFGLGARTGIGVDGESAGQLPDGDTWSDLTQATISFGQGLSVTAVQMAAAINAIANDGVYVSPNLVQGSAVTDSGAEVGTDHRVTRRVVSSKAASETAQMMERVLDPEEGVAPGAAIPGYRVAGKTGTAQFVDPDCGCYVDNLFNVSFAGFAPADDPRFTVYVVVKAPRNGGGGGSVAGPAFQQITSYLLSHYGVEPTGTKPSRLPLEW